MGKNMRHQDSSGIPLQNGNPGCMNKLFHALNRRRRWQNVRRVLPNKRQGSGKHIIDGEPTAETGQPPKVPHDTNLNKHKETEVSPITSKSSKKSRIRSLISSEMAKRRGKNHWRRSSPNHSPKKKSNSMKQLKNESWESDSFSKTSSEMSCLSPSTIKKKRKCDICAAMLTVSYLRQKALANEQYRNQEVIDEKEQHDSFETSSQLSDGNDSHYLHSHKPRHLRVGLTKSFSFPILKTTKTKDFELKELKRKLKDCKDIQTIKDKFILPMNQWNDPGFLKPMLTRPASFKSSCRTPQMEKKEATNNSKSVKQKLGFANNRKEKKRILMDAVFHKIPYGRRSSRNPRKISLDKLKSNSTSSGSDRLCIGDQKTHLKKTSSTSEAMGKYRRLLSQTSTRDDKLHLGDHKLRLFVAGEHFHGSNERNTHKRMRSLPDIGLYDFKHNQEFPEKPNMNNNLSIASDIFDEQMSLDPFVNRGNVHSATEGIRKETKLIFRDESSDENILEKNDHKLESKGEIGDEIKETKLVENDDNNDYELKPSVDIETNAMEGDLVNQDEETKLVSSDEQEKTCHQNEPRVVIEVEQDKNFNEILGMFKKVSDERKKQNDAIKSSGAQRKGAKNARGDNDHNVHKHLQDDQKTLDHHGKDKSTSQLTSCSDVDKDQDVYKNLEFDNEPLDLQEPSGSNHEMSIPGSIIDSSSLVNISKSPLKAFSEENQQYKISGHKRPNNKNLLETRMVEYHMVENGFSNLDLKSLKNNSEFQFVKQVLERSGFLETELLGEWFSSYQPIDPLLFEELETSLLQTKNLEELDSIEDEETAKKIIINDHHLLLFDLVNDALLELHSKTFTYCPHPLTYCSKVRPIPVGRCLLEQVWNVVCMYLSWKPVQQPSLDDVVSRDLEKGHRWMNLQADAEFVGVELEEMIVDDLLDELVFDDLLM